MNILMDKLSPAHALPCKAFSGPLRQNRRMASRLTVAVAKPSGAGDAADKKKSPAAKSSPKNKLPAKTTASSPSTGSPAVSSPSTRSPAVSRPSTRSPAVSRPSSRSPTAKAQVDDTASSAKQGVDDAAKGAKRAVSNVQQGSSSTRATVNNQASNLQQGIDQGADAAKDVLEGAPEGRANAKQTVSSGAGDLKENVDQGADALKDAIGGNTSSQRAQTRQTINEQADSVQDGIDAGQTAIKEGIDDSAAAAQRTADDFEKRATQAADRLEVNIDRTSDQVQEGIDQASKRLEGAIDQAPEQVAGAVQQAVDTTAEGIRGARRQLNDLQKQGPRAQFQNTPLTSMEARPFDNKPGPSRSQDKQAEYYKQRLFYCIAGLDRGQAANSSAAVEIEASVASLLTVSSPVLLSWAPEEGKQRSSLAQLNGLWRLLYSSAFAKGQAPSLPGYKLGQVYQGIQAYGSKLDNIVEFYSTLNLPQLPGLPKPDPVILTANLKHYFESVGGSTVRITFQDAELKLTGGVNGILGRLPEVSLPQLPESLRPSRSSRSSTFEVIYLDEDTRIIRGASGELRIFMKTAA